MVLVVLAIVWIAVLTPSLVKKLSSRHYSSVRSFRRFLRLGDRTHSQRTRSASLQGTVIGFSLASQRLQSARAGYDAFDDDASYGAGAPLEAMAVSGPVAPSPTMAARRRRVMIGLGSAVVVFFLAGLIPGLSVMWDLAVFTLGLAAAYMALLIHFHRVSVEHAQ